METVVEGEPGLLAPLAAPDSFAAAIGRIDALDVDPARAAANAERFSVAAFQSRLGAEIERLRGRLAEVAKNGKDGS